METRLETGQALALGTIAPLALPLFNSRAQVLIVPSDAAHCRGS
jgi:hypothetical protein